MPDLSTIALFCAATLALLVVPGPAVIFIVTRSVAQGRAAGLWLALGMASDGAYALLSSAMAGRVRHSARARRRLDVGSGLVYLGLAAWLTAEKA
ncbi:hypothetical protein ABZ297_14910 [Nonomuraea sp. NPDC005983]|uniref:hypothetical protein n=1 Tax=Nonomuraea sp. NPDC005983 TaxID=3155595 RepID=UPI0033A9661C